MERTFTQWLGLKKPCDHIWISVYHGALEVECDKCGTCVFDALEREEALELVRGFWSPKKNRIRRRIK